MNLNKIVDNINKTIKEEATTMDNISYLPGGGSTIKAAIHNLTKVKNEWNIEVLEEPKKNHVSFEKQLNISVLKPHWNEFTGIFGGKLQSGMISLDSFIKEAIDNQTDAVRTQSKVKLYKMTTKGVFKQIENAVIDWTRVFGMRSSSTTKAAISVLGRKKDIQSFIKRFYNRLEDDKGSLEMFLDAIENEDSLQQFPLFDSYEYLYGQRIVSKYEGVELIFSSYVDFMYHSNQSIYISNIDVIDELLSDNRGLKSEGSVVYSSSGTFDMKIFRKIKEYIDDLTERPMQEGIVI